MESEFGMWKLECGEVAIWRLLGVQKHSKVPISDNAMTYCPTRPYSTDSGIPPSSRDSAVHPSGIRLRRCVCVCVRAGVCVCAHARVGVGVGG